MNALADGMHTLNLDARQRAMLEEMGVKFWWPNAPVEAAAEAAPETTAAPVAEAPPAVEPPAPAPVAQRVPVAAPRAAPEPAPPARTGSSTDASVLADTPRRLYAEADAPAATGGWLVVADMPPGADGRHGAPFDGDAGRLLDNMLRALRLHTGGQPVHLVRIHRATSASGSGPAPADALLADALATLAPRIVLAMGPLAAQRLLQREEPLGRLRGQALPLAAQPQTTVVATYHPAYLLRNSADKGRAWADLCLAAASADAP